MKQDQPESPHAMISVEVSQFAIGSQINPPAFVTQLDWASRMIPKTAGGSEVGSLRYFGVSTSQGIRVKGSDEKN